MSKYFLSLEQESQIDALFKEWDTDHTPGAAVGIIKDGEFVYKKCFGMANLEYGIPITPDSKFNLASVSKQFTAACIALLILDGKLSIDDDVRKYIPELPQYDKTITIKHLLHHTSGLMTYDTLLKVKFGNFNQVFTNEDALHVILKQKFLNISPGEQCIYSNTGYLLLAEIVKRISGKPIRDFAHEAIFKPLGMNDTFYKDQVDTIVIKRVESYRKKDDGFLKFLEPDVTHGPTAVISTLDDLRKWNNNFKEKTIGGEKFIDLMYHTSEIEYYKDAHYSFGLVHGKHNSTINHISHSGRCWGFRTIVSMFPDNNISIIILCNSAEANSASTRIKIANIIFGLQAHNKEVTPFQIAKGLLQSYCGHYWNTEGGYSLEVFLEDSELFTTTNGKSKTKLFCMAENIFMWEDDENYTITFAPYESVKKMYVGFQQQKPEEFFAYEPVEPDDKYLEQFTGEYFSEDLYVHYDFKLENGELVNYRDGMKIATLRPVMSDKFLTFLSIPLTFMRNEKGIITGLVLYTFRARNIHFKKLKKGRK